MRRIPIGISVLVIAVVGTIVIAFLLADRGKEKTELVVSAAASLQGSLTEIEGAYEAGHPHVDLLFNYGASGALQQQIEQGVPADLFISAGKKQMDALKEKKLVSESGDLLANELVLVVPSDAAGEWNDLNPLKEAAVAKIAVGQPDAVPAGAYAEETLTNAGLLDAVGPKLVFGKDVKQVLSYVETGNAEAGFVYRTDALGSAQAKIALEVPSGLHKPIVYPAAVLTDSRHPKEAEAFYAYLAGDEAGEIFKKFGFTLP